jgi:hypothetical protein
MPALHKPKARPQNLVRWKGEILAGQTCSVGQVLPDWAQGLGCAWMRALERVRLVGEQQIESYE